MDRGADVNASNRWGNTPLHAAAWYGQTGIARCLMEKGADPTTVDHENKTPAELAEEREYPNVAAAIRSGQA